MLSFVGIKFFAMGLSSMRSLLLAAMLGPASYGVFGTLILMQQYLSYAALGMRDGVTVTLARAKRGAQDVAEVYASSLAWAAGAGATVWLGLLAAQFTNREVGEHLGWLGLVSMLSIVNEVLININRDQGSLAKIAQLEVLYNLVPLGVALWMWRDVTIGAMLRALAVGLLLSVVVYIATLPRLAGAHVRWRAVKRLLAVGFPVSAVSAVALLAHSVYILLANQMRLGETLGRVVFANTVCTLVLFALNTVAWAATGRSMRQHAGLGSPAEHLRAECLRTAFRVGVAAAALACLSTAVVFAVVLQDYAGAEVYAFYLCLFQAYGLLLFDEVNRLNVTGRSPWIIVGYGALFALVYGVRHAFPDASIASLMLVGIMAYFLLAVAAFWYCGTLQEAGPPNWSRLAFLSFPVCTSLLYAGSGSAAAAFACVAFAGLALWSHRSRWAASL